MEIRKFIKEYQDEVKNLILSGLKEHWGNLDPHLNQDLNDIYSNYQDDIFLTVWEDNKIIGTGAAKIQRGKADIVRMSVNPEYRRKGIGRKILDSLISELKIRDVKEVILETTETWEEVVKFYRKYGFEVTHKKDGDIYFKLLI